MSQKFAALGGNAGAVIAGGAMALALGFGAYIGFGRDDTTSPETVATPPQTNAAEPVSEPAEAAPQTADATGAQSPSFDEVRREPDGTTVIAGRAEPLSDVTILLDGTQVATAKADSTGGFAAIAMLPPQKTAQVVSLSAQTEEVVTPSLDEIILAPAAMSAPPPEETATDQAAATPQAKAPDAQAAEEASQVAAVPEAQQEPDQPAEVALLKSDAQGVSLLASTPPQAMTSVALDTIGYSDVGDVQLTGRAQPDTAKIRVYLDNRAVISLPVDAQGRWRGDLPNVDEGIYTLRVDEVSAQGDVSSRVETPFKRESAQTLAQAAGADAGAVKSITVQAGATLWAIARDRYGDGTLYVRVFEANAGSIRNPDLIYPGQVFDLPN